MIDWLIDCSTLRHCSKLRKHQPAAAAITCLVNSDCIGHLRKRERIRGSCHRRALKSSRPTLKNTIRFWLCQRLSGSTKFKFTLDIGWLILKLADAPCRTSPGKDTHRGVSRLGCQAGGVASDEAVLFIQPAGALQDTAKRKRRGIITSSNRFFGYSVRSSENNYYQLTLDVHDVYSLWERWFEVKRWGCRCLWRCGRPERRVETIKPSQGIKHWQTSSRNRPKGPQTFFFPFDVYIINHLLKKKSRRRDKMI